MTHEEVFALKVTRAITAVVMGELDDAFAAFRANPGGPGFGALHDAMWAAQYIKQPSHRDWIQKTMPDVPVGLWIEVLVKQAKAQ